jgi:hypothetical protein
MNSKLIISIDVEEDSWKSYVSNDFSVRNVRKICDLQRIFDDVGVKPTYLIDFPVAVDKYCISLLREIYSGGNCEIGVHCHPWNTPPLKEGIDRSQTMLCNLPDNVQYEKIRMLTHKVREGFDIDPASFRAGRWGYDKGITKSLLKLGYKVDSSVTPYIDWSRDFGPDFSSVGLRAFRHYASDCGDEVSGKHILEVPVSIGFLWRDFRSALVTKKLLETTVAKALKMKGILYKLGIFQLVWLSPENSTTNQMVKLSEILIKKNNPFINMVFHSSSLTCGLNPFVRTKAEERIFVRKLRDFILFAKERGLESITLSECVKFYR